jgi:agmatine deiminase
MPAEWEGHAATWLAWPYNLNTWEGHLEGAEEVYARFIEILTQRESVELCVPNEEVKERAQRKLAPLNSPHEHLRFHTIETGDVWFRDFGPLFVVRGNEVGWTKWKYNALGNKWEDLLIGDTVPAVMPIQDMPHFDAGIVLEGGSIDVNGSGSLLTTESCLLNSNRNPHLTRFEIEQRLKDYLGVTNVLWLAAGIAGDDTDGHVDDVTRFVGLSTAVTMIEEDPSDENYHVLKENHERLRRMCNERGRPLRVTTLPMPRPFEVEDRRMAASYANFYIANETVVVPTYAQPSDATAVNALQKLFPDRRVIGIDCRELIYGYGALHCITQQQPL